MNLLMSKTTTTTLVLTLLLIASFPVGLKSQNCNECNGTIISSADLDRYKQNYKDNFIGNDAEKAKKHPEWVYLPKVYINFFINYFNTVGNNTDGIWIFFINNGVKIDNNQQKDANQIMLNISGSENCSPEFARFNACVNASAEIRDNTKNKIHLSTRKNQSATSVINYAHLIGKTGEKIIENSFRYGEMYNDPTKYSKRVHLGRRHIEQLKSAIDGSGGNWNGIKLYFGSYGEMIQCTHMEYDSQVTLIALPVKDQNDTGNMDKYNDFLKKKNLVKNVNDIYNHGALCPQVCN